jgi:hypothetical protein
MALGMNACTSSHHNVRSAAKADSAAAPPQQGTNLSRQQIWFPDERAKQTRTERQSRESVKMNETQAIAGRFSLTASFLMRMDCRQEVSSLEFVETALNIFTALYHVARFPTSEISNNKICALVSPFLNSCRTAASGFKRIALQHRPGQATTEQKHPSPRNVMTGRKGGKMVIWRNQTRSKFQNGFRFQALIRGV